MLGYYWSKKLSERTVRMTCPEKPARCSILNPETVVHDNGTMKHYEIVECSADILNNVHAEEYVTFVRQSYDKHVRSLDSGDTRVTHDVFQSALLAASAACRAVDAVLDGELDSAFCATRPPGHHASRVRALGFCVFNNGAIAARRARQRGVGKVLILDWDVHPGNGAQEIFWEDPDVFTISVHEEFQLGHAGDPELVGEGAGRGFNLNIPVPAGASPDVFVSATESALDKVVREFKPEFLIIAAGFDAHKRDLPASQNLEEEHFVQLTRVAHELTAASTGGKTVSLLEGGYNPPALRDSVIAHCETLASLGSR